MIRWLAFLPVLLMGACVGDETLFKYGAAGKVWVLQELSGTPFSARATIEFKADGQTGGQAPCNRFFTKQTQPYPWFKLGPIGATKMACADLKAETAFFDALESMTLAEISGDTLILSNDAEEAMVFKSK